MLPLMISIPHCSAEIPEDISGSLALGAQEIIESVDFGSEEIFSALPSHHIIKAQWSRLVVDLNRAPDQIDKKGVVALTDYHGRRVYLPDRYPDHDGVIARVARFHRPYHDKLEKALADTNVIGLIDGHSLNGIGPHDAPDPGQPRKDVILSNNGDANGAPRPACGPVSCPPDRFQSFKQAFEGQGFSVSLNSPYQGGYITRHYGPQWVKKGGFAIQIEMNQSMYMRPGELEPDAQRVASVAQRVRRALKKIC